jgi:hypothetical protein
MKYTFDLKTIVSVFVYFSLLTAPTFMVIASSDIIN